jgi:hypothetical protein
VVRLTSLSGDQAGLFALISAGAAVVSAVLAGWALRRSADANTIARRALESQTGVRVNVRCRRGVNWKTAFNPGPTMAVIAVGENVGGLPVTIESASIMALMPDGVAMGAELVPTGVAEKFPFPRLPQTLEPRDVLQVPVAETWFRDAVAAYEAKGVRTVVLRLKTTTGVYFDSMPLSNARFDVECPLWVQGASDPLPRPPLIARLRARITR